MPLSVSAMSARMLHLLLTQYPGRVALGVEQAAIVLGLSAHTVRAWMREGRLPGARKVGGKWIVPLPELAEVLEPTVRAPELPARPRVASSSRRRRAVVMN